MTDLPQPCEDLLTVKPLAIAQQLIQCTASLGTFASQVLVCSSNPANLIPPSKMIDCIKDQLAGTCINALPPACAKLTIDTDIGVLASDATSCALALGPFAVSAVSNCLNPLNFDLSTLGLGVVDCLYDALDLPEPVVTTVSIPIDCPVDGAGCDVGLPEHCLALAGQVGLGIVVDMGLCATELVALGGFATGNVLTCLATTGLKKLVTGNGVLRCIFSALDAQCPTTLPPACTALSGILDNILLAAAIPACLAELGPYAAGAALTCLSTSGPLALSTGPEVISCLTTAFDL